jgi:XTP/dITP diphosphohydrolase
MKKSLVIASNNAHKVDEIRAVLGDRFDLLTLNDISFNEDIPETADTFVGNALIKARTIYEKFKMNCFADDSGLEIVALNNEPGVYSARYAGEPVDHSKNIDKVLQKLAGITDRSARFVTVIALIIDGEEFIFEGEVRGRITSERRGTNGFGYDPIFIPENETRTFAEMSNDEKISMSHRSRAIQKMVAKI